MISVRIFVYLGLYSWLSFYFWLSQNKYYDLKNKVWEIIKYKFSLLFREIFFHSKRSFAPLRCALDDHVLGLKGRVDRGSEATSIHSACLL
jgi:hypothetical protein